MSQTTDTTTAAATAAAVVAGASDNGKIYTITGVSEVCLSVSNNGKIVIELQPTTTIYLGGYLNSLATGTAYRINKIYKKIPKVRFTNSDLRPAAEYYAKV